MTALSLAGRQAGRVLRSWFAAVVFGAAGAWCYATHDTLGLAVVLVAAALRSLADLGHRVIVELAAVGVALERGADSLGTIADALAASEGYLADLPALTDTIAEAIINGGVGGVGDLPGTRDAGT